MRRLLLLSLLCSGIPLHALDLPAVLYGTERGIEVYRAERLMRLATFPEAHAVERLYEFDGTLVALVRGRGPWFSRDLGTTWEERFAGLPCAGGTVHELTAFSMLPSGITVAATPHRLWISTNRGRAWEELPRPRNTTYNTFHGLDIREAGGQLHILAATAFNGLQHGVRGADGRVRWNGGSNGLFGWLMEPRAFTYETLRGAVFADGRYHAAGGFGSGFYASPNGRYWGRASFAEQLGQFCALLRVPGGVQAVQEKGTALLGPDGRWTVQDNGYLLARGPRASGINCALGLSRQGGRLVAVPRFFSEPLTPGGDLWWRPDAAAARRRALASGKRAVYYYTWQATSFARFQAFVDTLKDSGINAVVLDMKDDWGNVVYDSRLELVKKTGARKVIIDVGRALALLKERGLYAIARLVVFKDKRLWSYNQGEHAIFDTHKKRPWVGGHNMEEHWVDPYSRFVHEYNAAIALELQGLGFDEIQFDYIRFPTDGAINNCEYRFKQDDTGKSQVLDAFLTLARGKLTVPVSVDIYGFNGWYRMGDKQGQDMRLLRRHVDVVCPMFYPSHFGVSFMGQDAYRILLEGTRRNVWLAGGRVLIRPYLQAFPLMARPWGTGYIHAQRRGTMEGGGDGWTWWNMLGDYRVTLQAEREHRQGGNK